MSIPLVLSGLVVVLFGLFCVGLSVTIVIDRPMAQRFLMGFAGSARAHFAEQIARLCTGVAMVFFSPLMTWGRAFGLLGWILVVTSMLLMLAPWRLHRRFAEWSLPVAFRYMRAFSVGSMALGVVVLYASLPGLFSLVRP